MTMAQSSCAVCESGHYNIMLHRIGFTTKDLGADSDLRRRERVVNDRLHSVVGDLCVMRCRDIESSRQAAMALWAGPEIVVGYLEELAITCHRGRRHIQKDGDDSLFVQLNHGRAAIGGSQFGRDYELAPGFGTISVHNASLDIQSHPGMGLLGITLPRHLTEDWSLAPEDLAGRVISLDQPSMRLLKHYAGLFHAEPDADDDLIAGATRHLAWLIGSGFSALKPREAGEKHARSIGTARLAAIRSHIARHSADPCLSAATTGRALGISERMVQHVLTAAGTSFSGLCGKLRAEKARILLLDPALDHVPVSEIGFLCGFNDVSAFYRVFRARYDDTPGGVRSRTR